jgi:hypothetical protein
MRALTIDARSAESALRLADALMEFNPELSGSDKEGYRITVEFGSVDQQVVAALDALGEYATAQTAEPAAVHPDGRRYTVHARQGPPRPQAD